MRFPPKERNMGSFTQGDLIIPKTAVYIGVIVVASLLLIVIALIGKRKKQ